MNGSARIRKILRWAVVVQILGLMASSPLVFGVTPLRLTLLLTVGQTLLIFSVVLYAIAVILELRSDGIL